jgi:hypothetical protein
MVQDGFRDVGRGHDAMDHQGLLRDLGDDLAGGLKKESPSVSQGTSRSWAVLPRAPHSCNSTPPCRLPYRAARCSDRSARHGDSHSVSSFSAFFSPLMVSMRSLTETSTALESNPPFLRHNVYVRCLAFQPNLWLIPYPPVGNFHSMLRCGHPIRHEPHSRQPS